MQDAFSGGSRVALLVALNPTAAQLQESEASLQFGLRAVAIKQIQARRKNSVDDVDSRALCARQEEALQAAQQLRHEREEALGQRSLASLPNHFTTFDSASIPVLTPLLPPTIPV